MDLPARPGPIVSPGAEPDRDGPPLADGEEWAAFNRLLARAVAGPWGRRPGVVRAAGELRASLESLAPLMEELAAQTCPGCRDVCCAAPRVWFQEADLLFLHLAGLPIPAGQTRSDLSRPCAFLTPRGCALDRLSRPWRCTWFVCGAQVELIAAWPTARQRALSRLTAGAQAARRELFRMWAEFSRESPSA